MMTYQRIEEFTPARVEFIRRHQDRFEKPPRAMWTCEDDGFPILAVTVYTEPQLLISAILDEPGRKLWKHLDKTTRMFEGWAREAGIRRYWFWVEESDDAYCRIVEHRGAVEIDRQDGWVHYEHDLFPEPAADGLRLWTPRDWRLLRPGVRAFLEEQDGDIVAFPCNVGHLVRQGIKAAGAGDPCILAQEDGKLVGFCIWMGVQTRLVLKEKVCSALGTYVSPGFRRQGWSKRLREFAAEKAREAGYARVDGPVLTTLNLEIAQAAGFEAAGTFCTRRL